MAKLYRCTACNKEIPREQWFTLTVKGHPCVSCPDCGKVYGDPNYTPPKPEDVCIAPGIPGSRMCKCKVHNKED